MSSPDPSRPASLEKRLAHAIELYQQRRYRQAAETASDGLIDFPDDGRFWQLLGVCCWSLGEWAHARTVLETASCLRPLAPLGQVALADVYRRTGHAEVARLMYHYLAGLDSCPPELMPKVAVGLGCLGEYNTALEVCTRLAQREPRHHAAFFGIAFYMGKLGYPPAALLSPLVKAHNLAPQVLPYRLNLALLYAELGRPAQAYFLLEAVRPEMVPPCFSLERLADIFAAVGDAERCRTFREWTAQAAEGGGLGG